ncbi:MAG: prepilin-type N-terminal cleavage/methylation domain-containing protein [Candidatus Eisenbacteria bacterium]|uniref:Prepilin-type N-terminal cleavage/methylation domain-containing protein n=1 Tax=Eiseniibacteriota bacterium TaxID=2212470 RepID=A0A538SD63_UNCEI|nr:MAG: prepilin-type N-terminal cleavage/methylation domain-containing protein [Candidatus Eisenbacteria bacterium]
MVHQLLTPVRGGRGRGGRERGFTLPELLIVIVIASVLAIAFSSMFIQAVKTYQFMDAEKDMLADTRYAEERVTRELKRVRNNTSISAATATTLTFVDRQNATVSFSWSGVSGADLLFTKSGVSQTLAKGVDSLAFRYWKQDGTAATPVLSPSATDIWRVTLYMRLIKGTQTVASFGSAFVRSL